MNRNTNVFITLNCFLLLAIVVFSNCSTARKAAKTQGMPAFMKIGHRGTRGHMPENTIESMEKAIELGANTIEMDVHISRDGKVIVYHDESFNPDYTTMPDGSEIPPADRKRYTFYQMDYAQIRPFVIGTKRYTLFPEQQLVRSYTPLLAELIDSVEAFTASHKYPPVYYLIEIKSSEKTDGFAQPAPEEFITVLMNVLDKQNLGKRLIIQSFDMRPLQVLHRRYPQVPLGFLTSDKKTSFNENLEKLGFTPAFYNPEFKLVTPEMIKNCDEKNIKITPWTVEEVADMKRLKAMGVDGIITDYVDRLENL
jgi:glycerophosphoryl diester phosphodiesterase